MRRVIAGTVLVLCALGIASLLQGHAVLTALIWMTGVLLAGSGIRQWG